MQKAAGLVRGQRALFQVFVPSNAVEDGFEMRTQALRGAQDVVHRFDVGTCNSGVGGMEDLERAVGVIRGRESCERTVSSQSAAMVMRGLCRGTGTPTVRELLLPPSQLVSRALELVRATGNLQVYHQ